MSDPILTEHSELETLARRVSERQVGNARLFLLRTPIRSVVTWRGSFKSYPTFDDNDDLVQSAVVSLLDKGTKRLDRFAVAELLEDRGANLSFSSDGLYVDVSGRALADDVPDVLALMAEQLREPLLDEEEFAKTKERMAASIRRSMENTGSQAVGSLVRHLYPRSHPNFSPAPEVRLERLADISIEDVRRFHEDHFGSNEFTLVVVGDVDDEAVTGAVSSSFGDWAPHDAAPDYAGTAEASTGGRSVVAVPEKQNVDVRMGHPVAFRRDDADYIPAFLANYVLGGNFSARLMQTIRDELGLTYGIRSALEGITTEYGGHWQVGVTLSVDHVERGIEETLGQVRRFVEDGVTEEELGDKKTTVIGSFKVSLATTSGLASSLLKNSERGFDVGYLDRFPDEVGGVTLDEVNAVIARHFKPDRLHIALAGTITDDARSQPGAEAAR